MAWTQCDCTVAQKCPQGKRGVDQKCQIWKGDAPRQYLPTLADLIDRRTIVLLKEIFIPEHRTEYHGEGELIDHDIDAILRSLPNQLTAKELRGMLIIMLSNRFIWENESKARAGGDEQDRLLKLTHSINGVRNRAKNIVAAFEDGRLDYKLDCLASELPREYGNWNIFGEEPA